MGTLNSFDLEMSTLRNLVFQEMLPLERQILVWSSQEIPQATKTSTTKTLYNIEVHLKKKCERGQKGVGNQLYLVTLLREKLFARLLEGANIGSALDLCHTL